MCVCWWGTLLSFYLRLQLSILDQEQKDPMKMTTPDYALLQQPLSISLSLSLSIFFHIKVNSVLSEKHNLILPLLVLCRIILHCIVLQLIISVLSLKFPCSFNSLDCVSKKNYLF